MRYELAVIRALTCLAALMVQLGLGAAIVLLACGRSEGFLDMLAATVALACVRYGRSVLSDVQQR